MTALIGMKAICDHMKRSESTVLMLYRDLEFPMNKIGGIWESDTDLISEWRKKTIRNGAVEDIRKPAHRNGRRKSARG